MSLLSSISPEENEKLTEFIQSILNEKMLNEIQKLMFDQHFYCRFLKAHNFDVAQAKMQLKLYLQWRKEQNVDTILDYDFTQHDTIKKLCPHGFHSVDKEGRPIFILQVGGIKFMELMSAVNDSKDLLVHFFIKELEHTWRVKFADCKEFVNKKGVDQMIAIIDLKGAKLKDLSNKQMVTVYKQAVLEFQRFFQEMLYKAFIVNAPMFFQGLWEDELSLTVDKSTLQKIQITGGESHPEMLTLIDENDLPDLYGGDCSCKAQCIYSEKGPWSEVENFVDYQNPGAESDDDDELDDMNEMQAISNKQLAGMFSMGGMGKSKKEEFKMQDDDGDQENLLNRKAADYDQQEQLDDLKNQLNMMSLKQNMNPVLGKSVNNNTEAGDTESSEEQAHLKKLQLSGQMQNNIIKVPDLINPTSQPKNKFQQS